MRSNNKYSFVIMSCLIFLQMLIALPVQARCSSEGGSCGGGGSIIRFPGQQEYILLDRLLLKPELASTRSKAFKDIDSSILNKAHISVLLPDDQQFFELAHMLIYSWKKKLQQNVSVSRVLMELIDQTIDRVPYIRTSREFQINSKYYLPESILKLRPEIRTAILYLTHLRGEPTGVAIISSPAWDIIDAKTKAGLIIHESLRQIQLLYQFSDLTDENLQLITAKIVDGVPDENFDFSNWMGRMLKHLCESKASIDSGQITYQPLNDMMSMVLQFHETLILKQRETSSKLKNYLVNESNRKDFFDALVSDGILKSQ